MKMRNLSLAVGLLFGFVACDDGPVEEHYAQMSQEGRTVNLTAHVTGLDSWPSEFSLVVAGFGEKEYAIISKTVVPDSDGEASVTLSGVSMEATTVELCMINKLRKRIVSYYTVDCAGEGDVIDMQVGDVNVNMFDAVQNEVFDNHCIMCHGGSTSAAAGLYLTEGRSYEALVNVPSSRRPGSVLVEPGSSEDSFLHAVLMGDAPEDRHGHEDILSVSYMHLIMLLDEWIDNGAKK